jgi:hypothetical protein
MEITDTGQWTMSKDCSMRHTIARSQYNCIFSEITLSLCVQVRHDSILAILCLSPQSDAKHRLMQSINRCYEPRKKEGREVPFVTCQMLSASRHVLNTASFNNSRPIIIRSRKCNYELATSRISQCRFVKWVTGSNSHTVSLHAPLSHSPTERRPLGNWAAYGQNSQHRQT